MGGRGLLLLGIEDQLVFGGASLILICLGREFGEGKNPQVVTLTTPRPQHNAPSWELLFWNPRGRVPSS